MALLTGREKAAISDVYFNGMPERVDGVVVTCDKIPCHPKMRRMFVQMCIEAGAIRMPENGLFDNEQDRADQIEWRILWGIQDLRRGGNLPAKVNPNMARTSR